jgi:nucleoside-diphosphate kinase
VTERTLFILKPNATAAGKIGAIVGMLEAAGLRVAALRMLRLTRERAEAFYAEHRGKPFYEPLVEFMLSGDIVAGVLEGEDAVARSRAVMGVTDPAEAGEGTIRALYGENVRRNAIHGSDSPATAAREIAYFFPDL